MLSYVNVVSCSVSNDGNEIVLEFKQRSPVIDGSTVENVHIEDVANIVMNADSARGLRDILIKALSE